MSLPAEPRPGEATQVRAVISDFGGVLTSPLIESFVAFQRSSGLTPQALGEAMARVAERSDGRHPLFELEKGLISEARFLGELELELGRSGGLTAFRETYFQHLRPNPEMVEFLRALKSDGLRLAMLTNNVREWEPHWRALIPEIDELFETVVDSAFVGTRKPERRIYEILLERLAPLGPAECLLIDDVEVNCEAARQIGMLAVRFESTGQAIGEVERLLGRAPEDGPPGRPRERERDADFGV